MSFYATQHHTGGHLEVICGPMFSGKTEEIIRRARRAEIARQKVQIFKHSIDTRYDENDIVSHSSLSERAVPLQDPKDILTSLEDLTRVVIIDEVQFFNDDLIPVVKKLVHRGQRVICAGLDMDHSGVPFGPVPYLMAMADEVFKIKAICTICGHQAGLSQRLEFHDDQLLVGAKESYEARCRYHYEGELAMNGPYRGQRELNLSLPRQADDKKATPPKQ